MIAVFVMFADPQLADYTAVGKNFLHSRGLLVEGPLDRVLPSGRVAVKTVPIPQAYVQNHRHYIMLDIMLGVAKFWQGEALSNMPAFRIRMAD